MNKHFKMTALAIMVSFGLTGCFISNDSSEDVKPATSISTKEEGKSDSKPTNEPKESTPTTQPEVPELPTNKEEPQPQPEPEKIVSVDSENNKWRIVKMDGYDASTSRRVFHRNDGYGLELDPNLLCGESYCPLIFAMSYARSYDSSVNATTQFDLNELAQKDGKPFLGVHSGSHTDNNFSGYVIDAYTNEKGELVITKENAKTVNYLFVNQPYSSYGMLYTNQNDIVSFFQGLGAAEQIKDGVEFDVYTYEVEQGQKIGKIMWNDNVKGNATYEGEVIATVTTYEPPHFDSLRHIPQVDGTIKLNAQFGDTWQTTYIAGGTLESKTVGTVALFRANIDHDLSAISDSYDTSGSGTLLSGHYRAQFVGKDLNDVIGQITLSKGSLQNLNKGSVFLYNAVFGATKQPKSE